MGTDANRCAGWHQRYQVANLSDRLRLQDVISSSSSFASLLTWDELTSVPQKFRHYRDPANLLTPLTYTFRRWRARKRSLRMPFSCSWDKNSIPRTCGTFQEDFPGRKIEYWIIWIYQQTLLFSYENSRGSTQNLLEVMEFKSS